MTTQALKKIFVSPPGADRVVSQEAANLVKAANADARETLQRLDNQAHQYAQSVLAEAIRIRRASGR